MKRLPAFILTSICVCLIWYLSLFRPPHVSMLDGIVGFDKVVHGTMYFGTCSVFWFEYLRSHRHWSRIKLMFVAVVIPILMSGIIELAQTYCTAYRSGEWADLLANSIGVLLALPVMFVMRKHIDKLQRIVENKKNK